jgi:hypothetical protein
MKTIIKFLFLFIALISISCEKDPIAPIGKGNINSISTNDPINISANSAVVGLNINNQGGEAIGTSGLHYALGNSNPNANDYTAIGSTSFGSTSLTLRDLIPGKTYFVKSYATTRSGKTYFGNLKSFNTSNHPSNFINGMVAYYPLNNDGIDHSNSNNSLSFLNFLQPVSSRFGSIKSAYLFNGANSTMYKNLPNGFSRGKNTYSIAFWFKPTVTTSGTIVGYGTGGGQNFASTYFKLNNFGGCSIYHWNYDWDIPFPFNPNFWYFVCITFDGNTERVYLKEFGTTRNWAIWSVTAPLINVNPLFISLGSRVANATGSASEFFNGSIDDVRIFNRQLSQSEIIDYWYNN